MIPGQAQQFFEAAAAQSGGSGGDFQIDRSLRFNSADSAHLKRTPSTSGNRRTFTFSSWVKLVESSGTRRYFFGASSANTGSPYNFIIGFGILNNQLCVANAANDIYKTEAVFRDFSAWYHIVWVVDTTESTTADRIKVYVNGVQQTLNFQGHGGANPPSLNEEYPISWTKPQGIGCIFDSAGTTVVGPFNGYLADVHFIDGQALAPTDFGEYDDNNNWNPKEYSGTYGTNGYRLDFSDNSSNSALGTDSSGNNNTWTVNNFVADIPSGSNGMNVALYTGNGSSQSITGLGFQPDFVWLKCRTSAFPNYLGDVVRGVTKLLKSNGQAAEITSSTGITSFDSDGFTLGSGSETNTNGEDFVAWCWKAGGAASSNTDGSLTSSISASQTYGFSVVTWTGNRTSGATVGHGLGSTPKWIVVKNRDQSSNWMVYHSATGAGGYLALNNTSAYAAASSVWNNTAPDSSVFTLGADSESNGNGDEMVAYCWAEVPTYSSIGSYTGNGSTSGPTITTGFRPRYIILKASSFAGEDWVIMDTARATSNPSDLLIKANTNEQEFQNSVYNTDFNDDGFTIKNTNPRWNTNGETYVYAAFAEKPDQSLIDSLLDTPTNYTADSGNNGGNYATFNPLNATGSGLSNGNLDLDGSSNFFQSTIMVDSGKYYFEFTKNGNGDNQFGIAYGGITAGSTGFRRVWRDNSGSPVWLTDGSNAGSGTALSCDVGDVIGVALDMDNNAVYFSKNGTYMNSGDPTSGSSKTGAIWTDLSGQSWGPNAGSNANGVDCSLNTGQRPFAYTPPTGFKSLCTQNLADPTIADGSTAMDVKTYTGNGSGQSISGLNFSPDLVWIKSRSAAYSHNLYDVIRGADEALFSDTTNAETTYNGRLTSFDSTGFTLGNTSTAGVGTNENNTTYVGWTWDAGSSTVSNTDGSITSSVRANQSAGFSIVSYTGTGTAATIGHGLNAAPSLVIVKSRSATGDWPVYSSAIGAGNKLYLNKTDASASSSNWNSTTPTSSVFSVGSSVETNLSSVTFIAYCFAPVAGYSAFGSYTGNGSSDGPFAFTGFRPKWIMFKATSASQEWMMYDAVRSEFNATDRTLQADGAQAEADPSNRPIDILSNGFKVRNSNTRINGNGTSMIYMAFAEHPFKTARAR